ncbi:hypothetical protein KCU77_g54, partial [Aureobasidium melanogenum]
MAVLPRIKVDSSPVGLSVAANVRKAARTPARERSLMVWVFVARGMVSSRRIPVSSTLKISCKASAESSFSLPADSGQRWI